MRRTIIPMMLLGDGEVGKSSLILRITGNKFDETILSTIGKGSYSYEIVLHGYKLKMKIWDTAGQERFKSMSLNAVKNVDGLLLVYSIANRESFNNLEAWLSQLNDVTDLKKKPVVIIGNKKDLESTREVEFNEGKEFADSRNLHFYEVSAKTGENVQEAFNDIFEQLYNIFEEEITGKKKYEKNETLNDVKKHKKKKFC